jgi:hypothetical protein
MEMDFPHTLANSASPISKVNIDLLIAAARHRQFVAMASNRASSQQGETRHKEYAPIANSIDAAIAFFAGCEKKGIEPSGAFLAVSTVENAKKSNCESVVYQCGSTYSKVQMLSMQDGDIPAIHCENF